MRRIPADRELPETVRAMLDPATYPHPVRKVEMSQTHISWVFVAGDRVYKMKKPVKLDFLDFSTLHRRIHYCHREVTLNRRLAPDVYLGVVPLRHAATGWAIGGKRGRMREPLVVMRRLDRGDCLLSLMERGKVGPPEIGAVGRRIADFHLSARRSPAIARYGRPERIAATVRENFREAAPFAVRILGEGPLRDLRGLTMEQLRSRASSMRRRVAEGRVLEGHGDLHARHVYLEQGRVLILDGIEFNYRFLYQDAACDLAFLTMDIRSLGHPDLAAALLNAYLDRTGDYGLLDVLPVYESYRAVVRGKIASMMAHGSAGSAAERERLEAQARRYFDLADDLLRPEGRPRVVLMAGVSGSGKSAVAMALAPRIGAVHLRSDVLRKVSLGIVPSDAVPASLAGRAYAPATSERVYRELARIAGSLFSEGRSVVVDATFLTRRQRLHFVEESRIPAEAALLAAIRPNARISGERLGRASREETLSDADGEVLRRQLTAWEPAAGFPGDALTLAAGDDPVVSAGRIVDRLAGDGGG